MIAVQSIHAFNNSNFKGNYALRLMGPSSLVTTAESMTVATGLINADGKGHVTGHGKFRSHGVTCDGTIKGTYIIQLNGTGTLSSIFNTSTPGCFNSVFDFSLALSNNGKSFELANTENDYMVGKLSRQDKINFKPSDLSGTYALSLQGTSSIVKANQAITVGTGVITADGHGGTTGTGTLRSAETTCHGNFSGNYVLNTDGTGTFATNFTTSSPGCFSSVVDMSIALFNKGNGVDLANIENDYLSGTLKRQIFR